ncbi:hypothetical protein AVEN_176581-1 [Araneus ventricosus]|uniref:Uncharacterized protein n=1 Tax=Araneus ventricosus TaxID=182803 RepID=A0A4Y2S3R2_ARAVE|nr:hypothetical protein AVEN_176581-1 [Araneus ventricosus]
MVHEGEHQQTDGNASFLRAARAGNVEKIIEHLKGNIDINTSNAVRYTFYFRNPDILLAILLILLRKSTGRCTVKTVQEAG